MTSQPHRKITINAQPYGQHPGYPKTPTGSLRSTPTSFSAIAPRQRGAVFRRTVQTEKKEGQQTRAVGGRHLDGRNCLHSQFLHFLAIILAIEDVPLLRAFEDRALLALYFLASGLVYFFFLVEQVFENLAGFLPNGVWIFNKLDFVHLLEVL